MLSKKEKSDYVICTNCESRNVYNNQVKRISNGFAGLPRTAFVGALVGAFEGCPVGAFERNMK